VTRAEEGDARVLARRWQNVIEDAERISAARSPDWATILRDALRDPAGDRQQEAAASLRNRYQHLHYVATTPEERAALRVALDRLGALWAWL
jgi:hypothetical protein